MLVFKILFEKEIIEVNPMLGISKRKFVKGTRQSLDESERVSINNHLKQNHKSFWNFSNIFFHSGCRITELLRLQVKDVNLERQRFMVLVKKGTDFKNCEKVIKDIALPFWQEIMQGSKPIDFVFGKGLCPVKEFIRPEQITRR